MTFFGVGLHCKYYVRMHPERSLVKQFESEALVEHYSHSATSNHHWAKNGISCTNDSVGKVPEIHSLHVLHVSLVYPLSDTPSVMSNVGYVAFPYLTQVKDMPTGKAHILVHRTYVRSVSCPCPVQIKDIPSVMSMTCIVAFLTLPTVVKDMS